MGLRLLLSEIQIYSMCCWIPETLNLMVIAQAYVGYKYSVLCERWAYVKDCSAVRTCAVCMLIDIPVFTLRGANESLLSWNYYLTTNEEGDISYVGYKNYKIEKKNEKWQFMQTPLSIADVNLHIPVGDNQRVSN